MEKTHSQTEHPFKIILDLIDTVTKDGCALTDYQCPMTLCQDCKTCHIPDQLAQARQRLALLTSSPRLELQIFVNAMERQMRYNEAKGKGDSYMYAKPEYMLDRLIGERGEMWELEAEILTGDRDETKLRHESLDVATIAFFIYYTSLLREENK